MPPDMREFIRRHRDAIDQIYHFVEGRSTRMEIACDLYKYRYEYSIDLKTAVEALKRKHHGTIVYRGFSRVMSEDHIEEIGEEPSPAFALDPLEADMVTALLEQANPTSLGEAMAGAGHDAGMVAEHLPRFRLKWLEVRKERWAQLFVMEPPEKT